MRAAAAAAFYPEMLILEAARGPINWIYADSKLLPTTGIGSLLGSTTGLNAAGLALPWRTKAGDYASEAQVAGEWKQLRGRGVIGDGYAYEQYATLFLDQTVVVWDFQRRAASMEAGVAGFLPDWHSLRADAQLATMSLVWNVGENVLNPTSPAYWQSLTTPLKAADYVGASDHCLVNGRTSERNRRNRKMFLQSARAELFAADPERLFGAAVRPSAHLIAGSDPNVPGSHAWWAQVLLREAKTYGGPLDGLFGPMSLAAWKAATGEKAPTLAGLTKLCDASKATLGIEASA
jgi:hypothetical protein